jgi:four helix bundle protein
MGHSYRDLLVWQKAIELVTEIYGITSHFPKHELYGLSNQLRRSAVSVPSNIAEGQGRLSQREFRQFLGQARGSLLETETQLLIAQKLGYMDQQTLDAVMEHSGEVSRMLHRLLQVISQNVAEQETRN